MAVASVLYTSFYSFVRDDATAVSEYYDVLFSTGSAVSQMLLGIRATLKFHVPFRVSPSTQPEPEEGARPREPQTAGIVQNASGQGSVVASTAFGVGDTSDEDDQDDSSAKKAADGGQDAESSDDAMLEDDSYGADDSAAGAAGGKKAGKSASKSGGAAAGKKGPKTRKVKASPALKKLQNPLLSDNSK